MASPNNPKSSAELIREHSKARVIRATPVNHIRRQLMKQREITRADVIDSLVRQFC